MSDLAERLQIQHHSTVELVDRLAARGLVSRTLGEADRREVYVQLSPRGEQVLNALTLPHKNELRRAAPALVAALYEVTGKRHGMGLRKTPHRKDGPKRKNGTASRASA